jgi:hypothetical protein
MTHHTVTVSLGLTVAAAPAAQVSEVLFVVGGSVPIQGEAIDGSSFYWTSGTRIAKASLTDGKTTTLYTVPANHTVFGVAVSGNSVCWLDTSAAVLMKLTPK